MWRSCSAARARGACASAAAARLAPARTDGSSVVVVPVLEHGRIAAVAEIGLALAFDAARPPWRARRAGCGCFRTARERRGRGAGQQRLEGGTARGVRHGAGLSAGFGVSFAACAGRTAYGPKVLLMKPPATATLSKLASRPLRRPAEASGVRPRGFGLTRAGLRGPGWRSGAAKSGRDGLRGCRRGQGTFWPPDRPRAGCDCRQPAFPKDIRAMQKRYTCGSIFHWYDLFTNP